VDYDLKVQDSATGKRYVLLNDDKVIEVFVMDSNLTDKVKNAIDAHKARKGEL